MRAALVAEHRQFCGVFDQIECDLPTLTQPAEVKRLARLVEGLLLRHAAAEEDLVLLAVDQMPGLSKHKRRCERFHEEHLEIDARLTQVAVADEVAEARRLLESALAASRRHFQHEERTVFPLLEQVMAPETLIKLGRLWILRHPRTPCQPDRARGTAKAATDRRTLAGSPPVH